ncbi:MAG TPA: redoxin domain-containing protein [Solirubrobacteraceae bacterium]|nr:redoxin domain-containing protein [Solirubrobacteraceae bacterium]
MHLAPGRPVPDLAVEAYVRDADGPVSFHLSDMQPRWLVLAVGARLSEIADLGALEDEFAAAGAALVAAAADGHDELAALMEGEPALGHVAFPVIADPAGAVPMAVRRRRAVVVADPDGIVRQATVADRPARELLRCLRALQARHDGMRLAA